jgi:hypothetical protein
MGEYSNEVVTLTLKDLPSHSRVSVSFDLFIIRSWDGNAINWPVEYSRQLFAPQGIIGPDIWTFQANGSTLLQTTFSNWLDSDPLMPNLPQAFPGSYPLGSYPAQTGASKVNSLCYNNHERPMDAIYPMSFVFDHTGDTVTVDFSAMGLQDITDESWGLDNIQVSLLGNAGQRHFSLFLPVVNR